MGVVGVKFNNRNKVYYFDDNGLKLKKNLTVIVDTDKGLQFGTVASFVPEKEINALKTALEAEDLAVIKEKTESLMQASMKLGEAMYKAQAAAQQAQGATQGADTGAAGEQAKDDKVVDADFEEVK